MRKCTAAKLLVHLGSSIPKHFGFEHLYSVHNLPAIYIQGYS